MSAAKQGEVWVWGAPGGGSLRYVVVVSDDAYNAKAWPMCAIVIRNATPSPYVVQLAESDPVSGYIVLGTLGSIPPEEFKNPAGTLTGATWDRMRAGLRTLLNL